MLNPILTRGYGNNSLHWAKTNKWDAIKLGKYEITYWGELPTYASEEDKRLFLKAAYRQYQQYVKMQTMLKNNLISLLDMSFPNINQLFSSSPRADGSQKWVDFAAAFWHCKCVSELSVKAFTAKYQKSCKNMVTISARKRLWKSMLLPVKSKEALFAFVGIDAPPYQSGQVDIRSSRISKRGSPALRRTLFLVTSVIQQRAPADDPVYLFMNRKRAEGKPYRVYMMASANKFLRIYYASVMAYLCENNT